MRYLGVDYGTKKVGLALSDEAGSMGFPHTIVATQELQSYLFELIKKEKIEAVVVGESRDFDGKDNPIMGEVRAFAVWVEHELKLPLFFEPETLTSAEARRQYEREAKSRAPMGRAIVDASAAALILTNYLSKHDHHR
jgi:putative holliday junction resolvase